MEGSRPFGHAASLRHVSVSAQITSTYDPVHSTATKGCSAQAHQEWYSHQATCRAIRVSALNGCLLGHVRNCMLTEQIAAHSCEDGGHLVFVNAPPHLWAQHRPPQRLLHSQSDRLRRDGGHYWALHTCLLPYTDITPFVLVLLLSLLLT